MLGKSACEVFGTVCSEKDFDVSDCCRIGVPNHQKHRPVKVCLKSKEDAKFLLKCARNLKELRFKNVFISPNRTPGEREERQKLVQQLKVKEMKIAEPNMHHYISGGTICSSDHKNRHDLAR